MLNLKEKEKYMKNSVHHTTKFWCTLSHNHCTYVSHRRNGAECVYCIVSPDGMMHSVNSLRAFMYGHNSYLLSFALHKIIVTWCSFTQCRLDDIH